MSVRLTIRTGKEPGKSAELAHGQLTIGRDESCDLAISDDKVSRKHAVVELDREGRAVLRDLDSRNGTFVNGEQVRSAVLNAGDHLRFGDTVVLADGATPAPPAQSREAAFAATKLSAPIPPAAPAPIERTAQRDAPVPPGRPLDPPPSASTIQRIKLQRSLRRTTIVGVVAIMVAIAVAVLFATGTLGGGQSAPPTAAQVIAGVAPSTVLVVADDGFGSGERGSGWVWDASRGLIVTNAHVTAGGIHYTIGQGQTMNLKSDGQGNIVAGPHSRPARLIGQALCEDIAVLKTSDTAGLRTMTRLSSQSQLRIGQGVIALGYPATVSLLQNPQFGANLTGDTGVVSQPRTTFPAIPGPAGRPTTGPYHNVILTDTPINPGNSGGPLVDYQSQLVGMNTAFREGVQAQNYAIGVDRINQVVPELIAGDNVCG